MHYFEEMEKRFFLDALYESIFPDVKNRNDIIVGINQYDKRTKQSFVVVSPSLNGNYFFKTKSIFYNRFKLSDYKIKKTDSFLAVPAEKSLNPQDLIDYMNMSYLNSVNVRTATDNYDLVKGLQVYLQKEFLKDFELVSPQVGDTILLEVKENSYIFEGSLKIKFF